MENKNKNEMMVFNNDAFGNLRGVNINGEGWLAGKDVVEALGYTLSKSHTYSEYLKKYVDEEDMLFLDKNSPLEQVVSFDYKQLGQRGGYLVNKSALYSLVLDSPLPQAKKFRRWVTSEVLPQIEQTGGYIPIKEEDDELTIMSKAFMIAQKTIDNKQRQIEQQQQTINEQQQVIDEQQEVIESQRDKVDFADTVSANEYDSIDMGTMAKLLAKDGIKIGRNRLFEILRTLNILMDDNLPYQRFIDSGYFEVVEYTMWIRNEPKLCRQTLVTGKGQLYVTKKVKEYFENKNKENNKNI